MPPITYSASTFQAVVNGSNVTVQIKPGTTTTRPVVWIGLCDQDTTPNEWPNPLPTNPSYVKYQQEVTVSNGTWSHPFTGVSSDTYVVVVIPKDPDAKVAAEKDHVNDVAVP